MLKKLLMSLCLFSACANADFTADLTDPKNLNLADMYPAFEIMRSLSFKDTGGEKSLLGFKSSKDSDNWNHVFVAQISANKVGEQKVYIFLPQTCTDSEKPAGKTTIKTNNQNVKYYRYCDGKNVYITPISAAGDNFLVGEFKKSEMVKFEFSDIMILFDATGFTKGWNSYGGDAL